MTVTPHPISLGPVVFTKSLVQAVPDYEPAGEAQLHPENKLDVSKMPDKEGAYVATMTSVLNPGLDKTVPYYFEMHCMGILHADSSLKEDEALRGVMITAHSVLYGAIREAVAWLTGRQPHGPLVLGLSVLQSKPKEPLPEN